MSKRTPKRKNTQTSDTPRPQKSSVAQEPELDVDDAPSKPQDASSSLPSTSPSRSKEQDRYAADQDRLIDSEENQGITEALFTSPGRSASKHHGQPTSPMYSIFTSALTPPAPMPITKPRVPESKEQPLLRFESPPRFGTPNRCGSSPSSRRSPSVFANSPVKSSSSSSPRKPQAVVHSPLPPAPIFVRDVTPMSQAASQALVVKEAQERNKYLSVQFDMARSALQNSNAKKPTLQESLHNIQGLSDNLDAFKLALENNEAEKAKLQKAEGMLAEKQEASRKIIKYRQQIAEAEAKMESAVRTHDRILRRKQNAEIIVREKLALLQTNSDKIQDLSVTASRLRVAAELWALEEVSQEDLVELDKAEVAAASQSTA